MGRVIHFDIGADKPERVSKFYKDTFGWKFEKWNGPMSYWMITTGNEKEPGINGGMGLKSDSGGMMSAMTIGVKDLDRTLKQIAANGGKVLQAKSAIPGVGWFASFLDTEGNTFGLMQDDKKAK